MRILNNQEKYCHHCDNWHSDTTRCESFQEINAMNNKELTLDKALQNDRKSYNRGYDNCKKKALEILRKPRQNADLSWEYCDLRFIEEIEDL